MKLYVADKETGTFFDEVQSIAEGLEMIKFYEEDDRRNGVFEADFYEIVDEEHCSVEY